jgi:hypothetical protein
LFIVPTWLFFAIQTVVMAYYLNVFLFVVFGGLTLFGWVLSRGLFVGLLDVALVANREMDVVVEENVAGVLLGAERWYLFLDGFIDMRKYREDTWTLQHFNGCVLHIAASAITEDQLAHFRSAMARGRTPEGVQAVIERGRCMEELEGGGTP